MYVDLIAEQLKYLFLLAESLLQLATTSYRDILLQSKECLPNDPSVFSGTCSLLLLLFKISNRIV